MAKYNQTVSEDYQKVAEEKLRGLIGMDWVLSISGSRITLIQRQGSVGRQTGRNSSAQEMQYPTNSIVSDTSTEAASVQESLWKLIQAFP
ncbi:hypothetical protein KSS87_013221 [Heliosperma pusillum]|nr:hypothetical protein KSS87_013221 [Heliosperma pusillum]